VAYQQITPAQDWVYVQLPIEPQYEIVVYPVAVWAMNEDGQVVGLISVPGGGHTDKIMGPTCRLVSPPPLRGVYKHFRELDKNEVQALETNKPVKITQS